MSITGGDIASPAAEDVLTSAEAGGRVIRGSAWRVGANGAGIVLGLATATLLLRHLGVAESGRYVTVMSLVAIAGQRRRQRAQRHRQPRAGSAGPHRPCGADRQHPRAAAVDHADRAAG